MLLDIIGEKTTESVKVLGLDDKIGFGKYKDMTLKEVIIKDWQYVKWAIIDSQHFYTDVNKVLEYHMENRPTLVPNDIMSFGKYKGSPLRRFAKQPDNTLYGFHKTTILSILIGRNSSNQIIM